VGLAAHDGIRDLCVCVGGRDAGAAVIRGRATREGVSELWLSWTAPRIRRGRACFEAQSRHGGARQSGSSMH
jgi:hypothetical protein